MKNQSNNDITIPYSDLEDAADFNLNKERKMNFKQLQKAVTNLNWNLSFYQFCREILQKNNQTNEQLENDIYCLEKWEDWQKLNGALHCFDSEIFERIITIYEQRQINHK